MNPKTNFRKWSCIQPNERWAVRTGMLVLLLLTLAPTVQAQDYAYTTNNGTINVTKYTGAGGAVTIPNTINGLPVTSIGGLGVDAFSWLTTVTDVTIPNSVTNIGYGAFFSCTSLASVTIPDSVINIGDYAFEFCTTLTSVTIPNSVTHIGDTWGFVFAGCTSLTNVTIPNSVTNIGVRAFNECISLTNITIPKSVVSIGDSAFMTCSNLAGVYFQGNAPSLGTNVFDFYYIERTPWGTQWIHVSDPVTVYYLPGVTGWGATFAGRPTALWNPQVQISIARICVRTNRFGFAITGSANILLVIEACTDLASPAWYPLQTITLTGGSSYFSDSQWTNYPGRFYRIRWP